MTDTPWALSEVARDTPPKRRTQEERLAIVEGLTENDMAVKLLTEGASYSQASARLMFSGLPELVNSWMEAEGKRRSTIDDVLLGMLMSFAAIYATTVARVSRSVASDEAATKLWQEIGDIAIKGTIGDVREYVAKKTGAKT